MKKYELPFANQIALWLVDNTSLTAEQIAEFCGINVLDVRQMLDGESHEIIVPVNPVTKGFLLLEDVKKCEKNHSLSLQDFSFFEEFGAKLKAPKTKNQISMAEKRERLNGALWLIEFFPKLQDSKIAKLTHTTVDTVTKIRKKTHPKMTSIVSKNPVTVNLCTQEEIDDEVTDL